MPATVATPVFTGPLELLLRLVNEHEVDLYDVPLAAVVDAFVAEVAGGDAVDLETVSEFLMIASVLVELKSRRLLPGDDGVEADEELVGWEERDLLLARLLECQAYAAAADTFSLLIERAARSVPRTAGLDEGFEATAPDLLEGVTPDEVAAAFRRATAERPVPVVDLYHVTVDTVTVAEAVAEIAARLPRFGPATFRSLTRHLTTRIEIIVRFLAVLELCKQGRVDLNQGRTFGELEVSRAKGGGDGEDPDRFSAVPATVGAGPYDEYEG